MSALTTNPVNGLSELLNWSLLPQTPLWQRDALRRLCAGPEIEASDEAELEEVLKGERTAEVLAQQHIGQTTGSYPKIALKSLSEVTNVNALAPKQTLSFTETGMNIVFGENWPGKSGYVRILKSICRARLEKKFDVIANIYGATAAAPQTAMVGYFEGSTHRSFQWVKGVTSPIALAAISVFDSAAGNIHVTGTNDIAYTPFPLLILGRLARAADNLRARINTEISDLEKQVPPSVTTFLGSKESQTGRLIQTLSEKTKLEDVELLTELSSEESGELLQLKKDFADDLNRPGFSGDPFV